MSLPSLLLPPDGRGISCTRTLLAAFQDTGLRPEVLHIVGVADAELSIDFGALAEGLADGAQVVLVGPHAAKAGHARSAIVWCEEKHGLSISVYPQTYQQYLIHCNNAAAPDFVALFHPGLDIHYFSWYPCLRYWVSVGIPILVSAYRVPGNIGETPSVVEKLLETLVGGGGGAGLWVIELENPHAVEEGAFNAGYFVIKSSQGELPILPEELYWALYQAMSKIGHPFAPRVGYIDVEADRGPVSDTNIALMDAIAEGAMRGAQVGEDGCDGETAVAFAISVVTSVVGPAAGENWRLAHTSGMARPTCDNCGEGFDSADWHLAICPAMGKMVLHCGDHIRLADLQRAEMNGLEGVLQRFDRQKQRWVVRIGERDALFKPVNLRSYKI